MIGSGRVAVVMAGMAGAIAATAGHAGAPPAPASPPAAFAKCAVCHAAKRGAPAGVGPNLWGVVGARAGSRPGYAYSAELKGSKIVWSQATLVKWIDNPQKLVPGTTMPPPGVSKPADQAAVAAYLATLK